MPGPPLQPGRETRVLASQPITISPPHPSNLFWSRHVGAHRDEDQASMPRASQTSDIVIDSFARDNRRRIRSETTEIQETPLDGDINNTPKTTHSQTLAASQAQCDDEAQEAYEPATPSPNKRGDGLHAPGNPASRTAGSLIQERRRTPDHHGNVNEYQNNFEKTKAEQWEQRKQRMMPKSTQRIAGTKANAASKRLKPVPQEGPRKKVKTKPTKGEKVVEVGTERDVLPSASGPNTNPVSSLPVPARASKGADTSARLDSALPTSGSIATSGGAKMRGKLVGELHRNANETGDLDISMDIDHREPKNDEFSKKSASAGKQASASRASGRKNVYVNRSEGLNIFDLQEESKSIGPKSMVLAKNVEKNPESSSMTKGGFSKTCGLSNNLSEASDKQTRTQENKVNYANVALKTSSIKATSNSPEAAQTAEPVNATDQSQASLKTIRVNSPFRHTTRSKAGQADWDYHGPEARSPTHAGHPHNLAGAAIVPAGSPKKTEKNVYKALHNQDQKRDYKAFEQDATGIIDNNDENCIVITDDERSNAELESDNGPFEREATETGHSTEKTTSPVTHSVLEKEMPMQTRGSVLATNATSAQGGTISSTQSQSLKEVKGETQAIDCREAMQWKERNKTSRAWPTVHPKQPSIEQSPENYAANRDSSTESERESNQRSSDQQASKMKVLPLIERHSSLEPRSVPTEKNRRSLSPSRDKKQIKKLPLNSVKQPSSASVESKLKLEKAPRLLPPSRSTHFPEPGSQFPPLHSRRDREESNESKNEGPQSELVDEHIHRQSPMVHFTAAGPMNQGTTSMPHAEEPFRETTELKHSKRPLMTDKNVQTTAEQEERLGLTAYAKSPKRTLQYTEQPIHQATRVNDIGNPLSISIDGSGRQLILGEASASEHEELPQLPDTAHIEPVVGQSQHDDDMSNAMASYCTVPTQILSQPPKILSSKLNAYALSPLPATQVPSSYAPEQVHQPNALEAEPESLKENNALPSPSKSMPEMLGLQSGATRFMRSLQAQIDAQTRRQVEGQPHAVEDPQATCVRGEGCGSDIVSLTSESSDSTEVVESEEDELSVERRETMEWEDALRPHQRDVAVVLGRMTRQLVRHLISTDDAVDDLVNDYERSGGELIQSMNNAHVQEYEELAQGLQGKKDVMMKLFRGVETNVSRGSKDVRGLGLKKDVVIKLEESHDTTLKSLQELMTMASEGVST